MSTYIILSRISPEAFQDPKDFKKHAETVMEMTKRDCPGVIFKESYVTRNFGGDIVERIPGKPLILFA